MRLKHNFVSVIWESMVCRDFMQSKSPTLLRIELFEKLIHVNFWGYYFIRFISSS